MIVTVVHILVRPENTGQFIAATLENHHHSTREPGNLRFDVLQHRDNPQAFTLYEAYVSDEAAAAHKQTDHYAKWRDAVASWMAAPRQGVAHDVIAPAQESAWKQ